MLYNVSRNEMFLLFGLGWILKISVNSPSPTRVYALTATLYTVDGSSPPIIIEVFVVVFAIKFVVLSPKEDLLKYTSYIVIIPLVTSGSDQVTTIDVEFIIPFTNK